MVVSVQVTNASSVIGLRGSFWLSITARTTIAAATNTDTTVDTIILVFLDGILFIPKKKYSRVEMIIYELKPNSVAQYKNLKKVERWMFQTQVKLHFFQPS